MVGRLFSGSNSYRYGFNGKEKSGEIYGDGNAYDFGARIQDPRIGRWLSVDPMQAKFAFLSPYNYAGNNPIFYEDPDGKVLKPYDENSKTQYEAHFKRVFNEKLATLLSDHLSIDGSHKPINPKEFNKALKGMSEQQKVIARAYYTTINSDKVIVGFISTNDKKVIPSELLLNKKDYDKWNGKTIGELSEEKGGLTSINDGSRAGADKNISAAILLNTKTDLTKFPVGVVNAQGYSGKIEADENSPTGSTMVPFAENNTDLDEVIVHEHGHALYSGGVISANKNSNLEAIQLGNQYRKMKGESPRSGDPDHGLFSQEPKNEPGSGNLKPTSPVTEAPSELKKN